MIQLMNQLLMELTNWFPMNKFWLSLKLWKMVFLNNNKKTYQLISLFLLTAYFFLLAFCNLLTKPLN